MTSNYYKKVVALLKYLEDNNIELESCGCCDGIKINGEGGWCIAPEYGITISNEGLKEWVKEYEEVIKNEINEELDKFNKRVILEEHCKELCKEYHKTRSIDAACRLADTLYDLLYN